MTKSAIITLFLVLRMSVRLLKSFVQFSRKTQDAPIRKSRYRSFVNAESSGGERGEGGIARPAMKGNRVGNSQHREGPPAPASPAPLRPESTAARTTRTGSDAVRWPETRFPAGPNRSRRSSARRPTGNPAPVRAERGLLLPTSAGPVLTP